MRAINKIAPEKTTTPTMMLVRLCASAALSRGVSVPTRARRSPVRRSPVR